MRVLLVTDAPMVPGAYGQQGKYLAQWLQQNGHPVLVFAPTYYGARLTYEGVTVVGGAAYADLAGDTLINHYAAEFQADVVITLKDVYVYHPQTLRTLSKPWVPIVPVDTEPVSLAVRNQLLYAMHSVALTRHAQQALKAENIQAWYAPHAVDVEFWTPGDVAAARKALGLPETAFVAAFVGQNNSFPSRKSLDQVILAWWQFVMRQPKGFDGVLYLHTSVTGRYGGVDVQALLQAINLPRANYRVVDQSLYDSGAIQPEMVRNVYRAADVLLNPSTGGGFELCGVEAQACGTPVIAVEWTAMRETVGAGGWRIPAAIGTGETVWSSLGGFRLMPSRAALVEGLRMAYEARGNTEIREQARAHVLQYDKRTVFGTYWAPIMRELEQVLTDARLEGAEADDRL